jgi:hypothetical protein
MPLVVAGHLVGQLLSAEPVDRDLRINPTQRVVVPHSGVDRPPTLTLHTRTPSPEKLRQVLCGSWDPDGPAGRCVPPWPTGLVQTFVL